MVASLGTSVVAAGFLRLLGEIRLISHIFFSDLLNLPIRSDQGIALLMPHELRHRFVDYCIGHAMHAVSQVATRLITFVLNVLTTRTVAPEAYGVRGWEAGVAYRSRLFF
jgi:hypothetical protein